MIRPLLICAAALSLAAVEPAQIVIGTEILRPAELVPPLGANDFGRMGADDWAANNFIPNPGNEPVVWRNLHRVRAVATDGLITIDGGGVGWYALWNSGFLSGAKVRIYRLADTQGQPLAVANNDIDAAKADRFIKVGETQIAPEGAPGLPDGGWLVEGYTNPHPGGQIDGRNTTVTDATVRNGTTYWYAVVTLSADGKESELTGEVSVTPQPGGDAGPAIRMPAEEDKLPDMWPNQAWSFTPQVVGGKAPLQWKLVSGSLPEGFTLDAATGTIAGKVPAQRPGEIVVRFAVTDAQGRSDERTMSVHPAKRQASEAKGTPQPASGIKAVARDGAVTISWQAAPGANAVRYGLRRSLKPKAEQRNGIILAKGAPSVCLGDYLAIERDYGGAPDMRYVNPRVRGIGNPFDQANWYWRADVKANRIALVPHPQPIPAEMTDPGRTCMQVQAGAGKQEIFHLTCISPDKGGESRWYGYFEVGKTYHVEFWMRQEGLADGGKVVFGMHGQLPQVTSTWTVDGSWKKFTYDFTAPEPPASCWHYGPGLTFTGPGTLWIDNGRLSRIDRPEDVQKPYVIGRLPLDELLKSQPASGRKGSHRIWFLNKNATMEGLTSWHGNSTWSPNWNTTVDGTLGMTLPMGLEFDLATGDGPATRMRPWIVIQHILHSEDDWRGLMEYLAAPFDPAKDSQQTKPWAFKRFQQRGHGRPWTDEFASIAIQFGNETWHNGVFDDWLGFSWRGSVWQGGRAYGLAMQYLSDEIRKSPYWASEKLETKLRFVIDGGYVNNGPNADGTLAPTAYGGQAMQASRSPDWLSQANYVGPKWETGDKSAQTYSDHGVQEVLLGWIADVKGKQDDMSATWKMLSGKGRPYELTAYEGGPSGYALPGQGSPEAVETNERYGKSQAMAVAALDAWLGSYQQGWTEQCFLGFGMGTHWSSHTGVHEGFRPCPGWLALTLRNRYASGALMRAEVVSAPVIAKGKGSYPLVGAYAMRDGDRWSVFLLSRSLTERIPTTVKLPFQAAAKVSLHQLAADPRATNRQKTEVQIEDRDLPTTTVQGGTLAVELPPGAIQLYVFEGAR